VSSECARFDVSRFSACSTTDSVRADSDSCYLLHTDSHVNVSLCATSLDDIAELASSQTIAPSRPRLAQRWRLDDSRRSSRSCEPRARLLKELARPLRRGIVSGPVPPCLRCSVSVRCISPLRDRRPGSPSPKLSVCMSSRVSWQAHRTECTEAGCPDETTDRPQRNTSERADEATERTNNRNHHQHPHGDHATQPRHGQPTHRRGEGDDDEGKGQPRTHSTRERASSGQATRKARSRDTGVSKHVLPVCLSQTCSYRLCFLPTHSWWSSRRDDAAAPDRASSLDRPPGIRTVLRSDTSCRR
jgi:hypothetical protein